MERSEKSERFAFLSRRTHLLTTCRRQAVVSPTANGALAEGSSNSLCSFAVNSDSFVNHKTMYQCHIDT